MVSKKGIPLVLLMAITVIFIITGGKTNQYGLIDTLLSLPTSQSLWETGHVYLDPYLDQTIVPEGQTLAEISGGFRTAEVDGNVVDYFPAGPAIITLPITAVLNSIGYNFFDPGTNLAVQNRLSFITASAALLLLFVLTRLWHSAWEATLFVLLVFFGSSVFSTMGSAFWSINYTVIFNVAVLILLSARQTVFKDGRYHTAIGIAVGILLFLSFFCRVSSVAIVVCTLVYLLLIDFKQAIISGSTALICLALFAGWSLSEYGLILPPYYGLNRLNDAPVPMWVGLYGNLLSPSRGVLVYMPWLLLPIGWVALRPQLRRNPLIIYCIVWFVLQLVIASRAVVWWGGGSFGPRLLVEVMPALILFTVLAWKDLKSTDFKSRPWLTTSFIVICLFSIWVHSWQAFFNPFTAGHWYASAPAVVGDPAEDLGPYFEWSFAQWNADAASVCEMDRVHFEERIIPYENSLEPISFDQNVPYTADNNQDFNERAMFEILTGEKAVAFEAGRGNQALFQGMFFEERGGRWSVCSSAIVYFQLSENNFLDGSELTLNLDLAALDAQSISLSINQKGIGNIQLDESPQTYSIPLQANLLKLGELNTLELEISTNRKPTLEQDQIAFNGPLGIQLIGFQLSQP
ncbi:MAG: hypothetical protein AB8G95_22225 [Anaerolineae bacterium]